jgi:hypothetical protein
MTHFHPQILTATNASEIESVSAIQELWAGYGAIVRIKLKGGNFPSVVAKHIKLSHTGNHPRNWGTRFAHQRKIKSYEVELHWYTHYAQQYNAACVTPKCLGVFEQGDEKLLLLEDLNASGYSLRRKGLLVDEAKIVLAWLANFHAVYMHKQPKGLWEQGTYWHLATRPDEHEKMEAGALKNQATYMDQVLQGCVYQTIVHGDAKLANFCFSEDMQKVAAVDFQYVGGGCGMKDVVYFLGSSLDEHTCRLHEEELLSHYFDQLQKALAVCHPSMKAQDVEKEYRSLYAIAWTDFTRFLMGWMPTHHKLNDYSKALMDRVLKES